MPDVTTPLPTGCIVPVAGVSFHQEAVAGVLEGTPVTLAHCPSTQDQWAIQVTTLLGTLLGYVPKAISPRLSSFHPGCCWDAVVVEVLHGETTGLRVKVGERHEGVDLSFRGTQDDVSLITDPPAEADKPAPVLHLLGPSDRFLGVVVEQNEKVIRVLNVDGHICAYPTDLKVVRVVEVTPA